MSGKPWYNNGIIEIQIGPNEPIPDGFIRGRKPMDPEQKALRTQKYQQTYNNKTDAEKHLINQKKSILGTNYWNSLSDSEKQSLISNRKDGLNAMDDEEKALRNTNISQSTKGKNLGNTPWNKGLTRETDTRIDNLSKKTSETNKLKAQEIKKIDPDFFIKWRHQVSDTMKSNNSYNSSKPEEDYYKYLLTKFDETDILRQYSDTRYPFDCDFYIKSLDLFIEINAHWTHGGHPFDKTNLDDISKLEDWE